MKQDEVKAYLKDVVANLRQQDLIKSRIKDTYDSIKDSEESLGITLADFKTAVVSAYNYEKAQDKIDKLQRGLGIVEQLGV